MIALEGGPSKAAGSSNRVALDHAAMDGMPQQPLASAKNT